MKAKILPTLAAILLASCASLQEETKPTNNYNNRTCEYLMSMTPKVEFNTESRVLGMVDWKEEIAAATCYDVCSLASLKNDGINIEELAKMTNIDNILAKMPKGKRLTQSKKYEFYAPPFLCYATVAEIKK